MTIIVLNPVKNMSSQANFVCILYFFSCLFFCFYAFLFVVFDYHVLSRKSMPHNFPGQKNHVWSKLNHWLGIRQWSFKSIEYDGTFLLQSDIMERPIYSIDDFSKGFLPVHRLPCIVATPRGQSALPLKRENLHLLKMYFF